MSEPIKILLIDIERAPALAYIWDLKTRYVPLSQIKTDGYMLSFAAGWLGEDIIEFCSEWGDGHKHMVERAWLLLDEADAVITYNGNGYDLPHLNTEFLTARLGPPSPSHSIDLYQTVSNKFRVLSKSMRHLLDKLSLENKLKNSGRQLWAGCMKGDKACHKSMAEYNLRDVEVMEELYEELRPWIRNAPNQALWMTPGDKPRCRCGSTDLRFKGYKRTSVMSYKQYRCNECGSYPRERFAQETGKDRRKDILT